MPDFMDILTLRMTAILPQAIAGLGVAVVFWLLARFVGALVMRLQMRVKDDQRDLVGLLADVVGWALFIIGVVAGLGTAGVNVTALVTGLGLTGFAVGFALKDILANLMAGVLIMMFRPFGRGDRVRMDKYQGTVTAIDLRYTTLEAPGARVLIPNAKAYTEVVVVLTGEAAAQDDTQAGNQATRQAAPQLKVQAKQDAARPAPSAQPAQSAKPTPRQPRG